MATAGSSDLNLGVNGFGRIGKLTVWHHVARKYFKEIVVNIGRTAGTSSPVRMTSPTRSNNRLPRLPLGCDSAKSSAVKPRHSSSATARASPIASVAVVLAVVGIQGLRTLGTELLPPSDPRQFSVRLVGPPGQRVEATARVAAVVEEAEQAAEEAVEAVEAVFDAMKAAMQRGERIELRGFGVFQVKPRKKGIGRNPRTGMEVRIPPGKTIRFKPGKNLRNLT
mgnify:CR=1 FL=1